MALTPLPWRLGFFHPASLIATWFGAGRLPKAPGTWGSLAALPIAWAIGHEWGGGGLLVSAIILLAVGLVCVRRVLRDCPLKDPGVIVIDEVAGQLLTLGAVPMHAAAHSATGLFGDLGFYILGFLAFRAADILKPWPIRSIERAGGDTPLGAAFGVMADDLMAAVYAAAAIVVVQAAI